MEQSYHHIFMVVPTEQQMLQLHAGALSYHQGNSKKKAMTAHIIITKINYHPIIVWHMSNLSLSSLDI